MRGPLLSRYLILGILLGHSEGFCHSLRTAVHNLHLQNHSQTLLGYKDKKAKYLIKICRSTFTGSERNVFSRCLKILPLIPDSSYGTRVGTGTATFCLSGTGFGPGSNIKWNKSKKNIKGQLSKKQCCLMLIALRRQNFVQIFRCLKNCAK